MKVGIIVEARMKSTRLPGKVLTPIGSKNSLEHIQQRLKSLENMELCIATTKSKLDDEIEHWANSLGIFTYRGSEEDVLSRVLGAAHELNLDVIVEVTGDCPFVDPNLVDQFLEILVCNGADYVSNNIVSTFPDGFDVQVFHIDALKRSDLLAHKREEREHVTMHIRQNPQLFKTINIIAPRPYRHPELSVTLDTKEDLEVLRLIDEHFKNAQIANYMEITNFLLNNPRISRINSSVKRKGYGL
jgi:spore coat polysaccharide biosynthesis protein SpsF